ncbi:MAG: TonB-dependent receptor [Cyclobacteriaceae bacterium]|jgi:outer membrane receptor for ferrienterochelin and colicins
MHKYIFTSLILVLNTITSGYTQETDANIFGDVKSGGEHLPFINIYLKGTTIGTTTDHSGHFQLINLDPGDYILIAQGVGYKTRDVEVTVEKNKTLEVRFTLEEDVLNLEGVVVTADRREVSRKEAPVVVSTVSSKQLAAIQAVTAADALNFVPGLRMECNCANCGFTQVRMCGLDGPYSQILINSRPIFSGLAGVYGLELLPAPMIDQVEVVRGGGSAMFGGNAIAGTVNIITKEPTLNSFTIDGRIGIIGVGNDHSTTPAKDRILNVNGSIVTNDLKSGITLYGFVRERDPFDENGDDFSELVTMSNTTFGFNAYHRTSKYGKLSLDFYRINEYRRGGNKFDYLPHEADIAEQLDHVITGANLSYDLFTNPEKLNKLSLYIAGQRVKRDSYYGAEQDPDAYGNTKDLTTSIGGQYHVNFTKQSSILFGIDDNFNRLKDIKLGANGNPNSIVVDQYVNTLGLFSQYEFKSRFVKTTFGLRYDTYIIRDLNETSDEDSMDDVNGNVLAPRLNFLFDLTSSLQLRLSYSKGYRAPQIFDEDLHIEASGARSIIHRNAPDLKQETSHSFISSLRYNQIIGKTVSEFLAEGFYTRLIDPFAYEYIWDADEENLYQIRKNAEYDAYVTGVNLEFNVAFPKHITMQLGYTIQRSRYDSPQSWGDDETSVTTEFLRSPDQYGYLTLDWHPSRRWEVTFTATYTGSMYVPHYGLEPISEEEYEWIENGDWDNIDEGRQSEIEAILNGDVIEGERLEKSERFLVFGVRLAYTQPISKAASLQFYGGVDNLFNQTQAHHDSGIYRDAGYIYGPCQPRTINFGLKFGNIFSH